MIEKYFFINANDTAFSEMKTRGLFANSESLRVFTSSSRACPVHFYPKISPDVLEQFLFSSEGRSK